MSRWLGVVALVCLLAGISMSFAQAPQRGTAQAPTRPAQQLPSGPKYSVAGLALGSRVQFNSVDYREYKCSPSEQFAEFTWCQKTRQERDRRRSSNVTYSVLHSQNGTVLYVNRFQEPAVFAPNQATEAIRRNSIRLGTQARIERLARRPGFPEGTLATWGKVTLEPLDSESINALAEGRSPKKGYLIDFIGNFTRSAKEGLPIYRITGGAGFLWVASYDRRGRGTLRFAAIDPSGIHPTPLLSEARSSDPQPTAPNPEPTAAERTNQNAPAEGVAFREAKEAAEKAKADAEVARNELEAAKRDAQLAKAEAERLSTETTKLNAALERLETEKIAAETKAHTTEWVAYGAVAILTAFLVLLFIANRRKAMIADRKRVGAETEPAQVLNGPQFLQQARSHDSVSQAPAQEGDTASSSPEVSQASTSDANIAIDQSESGASGTKSSPDPNADEVNVTTSSDKAHLEVTASHG